MDCEALDAATKNIPQSMHRWAVRLTAEKPPTETVISRRGLWPD